MKKLLVVPFACIALAFAACGDDDDDGDAADTGGEVATMQETETAESPTEDGGETVTVDMKDIKYVPQDITVRAGTTVKWTNSDQVPHTVTKDSGPGEDFDSGNIEAGGEYEQVFDGTGRVGYLCTIHPGQEGSVTVE